MNDHETQHRTEYHDVFLTMPWRVSAPSCSPAGRAVSDRTAGSAAELNEDGEAGLLRLTEIWCAMNGVPAIVSSRAASLSCWATVVAQITPICFSTPPVNPVGLAVYVELRYMDGSLMLGEWFE